VKIANLQKDSREDLLVHLCVTRRWHWDVFPLQPPRRINERSVLFGESCTGKTIVRGVDLFYLLRSRSRCSPELTGLFRIKVTHDEPVSLLKRLDVLVGVRTNRDTVHAERKQTLDFTLIHKFPHLGPRILAIDLRQIVVGPVVFLLSRITIKSL